MVNVDRGILIRMVIIASAVVATASMGCQKAYYGTMEKLGVHKREILVDRVAEARDSGEAGEEQFASALGRFRATTDFQGGDLGEIYDTLEMEFDRCEERAETVGDRIAAVEDVGEALFDEWEAELAQYTSTKLRDDSRRKLDQTEQQYDRLLRAMHKAKAKIEPVLDAFRDQVLYLKHNLNAQAIASLQSELSSVETDVDALIRDMEKAIAEADDFIVAMNR
jgi:hypothetical protein